MTASQTRYRGRFAPSPTGLLHQGSLLAAVVSYLDARSQGGQWLVRMEDLDPPREQPGAADAILRSLEAHGLGWDGPVVYQSHLLRQQAYEDALVELQRHGRVFWCRCSRKKRAGQPVYPGTCRHFTTPRPDASVRFRALEHGQDFDDIFQGRQRCDLAADYGDVVIRRRDGLFAYMLAVVIDDRDCGITDVIRGIDLLTSTFWQQSILMALGAPLPRYGHCPVIVAPNGQKLSKQNRAPALDDGLATDNLQAIFRYLGIAVDRDFPAVMLAQASELWSADVVRGRQQLPATDYNPG